MVVIAEITLRGITQEQYDAVRARTGWLEHRPDGGLAHLTWWDGPDCRNVDAWESEAAFQAFGEQRLGPAMASLGIDAPPEVTFHPAHEVFTPQRGIVAATPIPDAARTDNVALVRSGYASFNAGDIPAVLAIMDRDVAWTTPDSVAFGGRRNGSDDVAAFFGSLPQHFAELRVEPGTYVDGGDTVVVQGTHNGRTAAGGDFSIAFAHVWTVRGGRVTGFTEYLDTATLNAALGPQTPAGAEAPVAAGPSA